MADDFTAIQEAAETVRAAQARVIGQIERALTNSPATAGFPADVIKQIAVQGAQIVAMNAQPSGPVEP